MKSEDKDEFLTWLDADEDDNKVDADDEKKSRLKGAGNLSVITATPEVNDTITNAMRAVEKLLLTQLMNLFRCTETFHKSKTLTLMAMP